MDGGICESNEINPTIELPTGEHVIELIVYDGTDDSEPDEVVLKVLTPLDALSELGETVEAMNLDKGICNSLLAKLDAAMQKLKDDIGANDIAAVNSLNAFINAVNAQSGKKISEWNATDLIAAAQQIIDMLR